MRFFYFKHSILLFLLLIFSLPYILGFFTVENYRPCNVIAYHDCNAYPAIARDFYDGNYLVEDHMVYENKGVNISPLSILNPLVYSVFFFLFLPSLGFNFSLIVGKLFFIALGYYLFFVIGKRVFKDDLYGIFFSVVIITQMVYKDLVLITFYTMSLISGPLTKFFLGFLGRDLESLVISAPLIFDRIPRPNFTAVLLGLSIICLLNILEKKEQKLSRIIFYGLVWSLLFYSYFYYFVVFFSTVGLLLIFYFFNQKEVFTRLLKTVIFSLFFSIPYWVNYFYLRNASFYQDFVFRAGIEKGYHLRFVTDNFIFIISLIIFIILKKHIVKEWFYFCIAFFIAGNIGLNLQVISGFNPQPDHFLKLLVDSFAFMNLTILNVLLNKTRVKKKLILFLILTVLSLSFIWQIGYFETKKPLFSMNAEEIEIYEWLNKNEKNTSVVLTDYIPMNYHVTLYTKHDVFLPGETFTILKSEELEKRLLLMYAVLNYSDFEMANSLKNPLRDKPLSRAENILYSEELETQGMLNYIYGHRFEDRPKKRVMIGFVKTNRTINSEDIEKIVQKYKTLEKTLPWKVDYIVTKRELGEVINFGNLHFEKILSNGKFNMYQLEP